MNLTSEAWIDFCEIGLLSMSEKFTSQVSHFWNNINLGFRQEWYHDKILSVIFFLVIGQTKVRQTQRATKVPKYSPVLYPYPGQQPMS